MFATGSSTNSQYNLLDTLETMASTHSTSHSPDTPESAHQKASPIGRYGLSHGAKEWLGGFLARRGVLCIHVRVSSDTLSGVPLSITTEPKLEWKFRAIGL